MVICLGVMKGKNEYNFILVFFALFAVCCIMFLGDDDEKNSFFCFAFFTCGLW